MTAIAFFIIFLPLMHFSASFPTLETDPITNEVQVRLWNYIRREVDQDSNDAVDKYEFRQWLEKSNRYFRRKQTELHFASYRRVMREEVEVVRKEDVSENIRVPGSKCHFSVSGMCDLLEASNKKRFSEADRDGDGVLTLQEFESFLFPRDHVLAGEFIDWLTSSSENMTQVSLTEPFQQQLIQLLNVKNKTIDVNRDRILDVEEVIRWLIPAEGDFIYNEADHIFALHDTNSDWDLNEEEVRDAYLLLIHLLPQSAWTDSSLAMSQTQSIEVDDFSADVVAEDNIHQHYTFLPNASSLQNYEQQSCDRQLPFAIPLLQVCDIPRLRSR